MEARSERAWRRMERRRVAALMRRQANGLFSVALAAARRRGAGLRMRAA
jgi:hypothetical protein